VCVCGGGLGAGRCGESLSNITADAEVVGMWLEEDRESNEAPRPHILNPHTHSLSLSLSLTFSLSDHLRSSCVHGELGCEQCAPPGHLRPIPECIPPDKPKADGPRPKDTSAMFSVSLCPSLCLSLSLSLSLSLCLLSLSLFFLSHSLYLPISPR